MFGCGGARTDTGTAIPQILIEVLQINLHQCKAACHILSKRLQKVQTFICLIQEPWFFKGRLRGINSVDSQLVYHRGGIRPRAAVFIKGMQCRIVPGFVTRDLVALQVKIGESGDQRDVIICSAYFPSDSGTPPPPKEFKELIEYCAERKLELLTGCDATPIILYGAVQMSTQGGRIYVSISWHNNSWSLIKEKQPRLLRG